MPEDIIKTSPESQDPAALQVAVFQYNHPTLGGIKIPYTSIVDLPSYVVCLVNSAVAANKNHLTFWNGSTRRLRIRKIEASAHITGNITGATIMLSVEGLGTPAPTGGTDITNQVRPMSTNFEALPTGVSVRAAPTAANVVANYVFAIKPLHIEEAVTTSGDVVELFLKDTAISTVQLEQNQGITIRQGSLAGAGALNLMIYFSLD